MYSSYTQYTGHPSQIRRRSKGGHNEISTVLLSAGMENLYGMSKFDHVLDSGFIFVEANF